MDWCEIQFRVVLVTLFIHCVLHMKLCTIIISMLLFSQISENANYFDNTH